MPGFLLVLLYCLISGFAGVYLEYLMKRRTKQLNSFQFQNVQVSTWDVGGVCVGMLNLCLAVWLPSCHWHAKKAVRLRGHTQCNPIVHLLLEGRPERGYGCPPCI